MSNILLIGIQGSGKGTQAKILKEKFNYIHINMGQKLRSLLHDGTTLSEEIRDILSRGLFVPDEFAENIFEKTLDKRTDDIVLDGFPRNMNQVKFLEKFINPTHVFYFQQDKDISIKRLLARRICESCNADFNLETKPPKRKHICDYCGGKLISRDDDYLESIKVRFELFEKETLPIVEYYQKKNILYKIDSSLSPESIHDKIIYYLGKG